MRYPRVMTSLVLLGILFLGSRELVAQSQVITTRRSTYSIGLAAQILYPDRLPDFKTSIATYGVVGSVPVGTHAIQVQANYGRSDDLSLYLFEGNFRFNIDTPFIDFFLFAGVHYFHFDYIDNDHWRFGGNGGPGVRMKLGENLDGQVIMKLYLQDKTVVAFGGGITFLL
jgi:hypothetical protein